MSPEANQPEIQKPSEISTTEHPEGVRPFTADLADVHEHLESPDDVSAIDPITRNVEFDRLPSPTTEPATTETVSADTEVRSGWKKWVAGVVGSVVLAGGGVAVYQANADSERPVDTASATPNPGEATSEPEEAVKPEVAGETVIAGLNKKSTPEQIQYVIDTPVNIADHPTSGKAVAALGDRWNVMANSGVIDYQLTTPDSIVFTEDDQANLESMSGSVLDVTSPNYSANLESIYSRRGQIAAMFEAQSDAESQVNFVAVTNKDATLEPNTSVELEVNTIWTTNVPDTQTGNGNYNNDYKSVMTLSVDAAGRVHVYSSQNVTDIGNIG